jgi:hypothetical protein
MSVYSFIDVVSRLAILVLLFLWAWKSAWWR